MYHISSFFFISNSIQTMIIPIVFSNFDLGRAVRCAKCTRKYHFQWYSKFMCSIFSTDMEYCWVKSLISKNWDHTFFSKWKVLNGRADLYLFSIFAVSITTSTTHRTINWPIQWNLICEKHGFSNLNSAMDWLAMKSLRHSIQVIINLRKHFNYCALLCK